jgi:DEAD/DEAH box helicase domain-containing protein
VRTQVIGYQRRDTTTGDLIENVPLELPPTSLVTRAVWYVVPPAVAAAAGVGPDELPGALHAAEHTAIGMLPLFTICDRWDVGGLSTPHLPETGAPTILVYDGYPGGSGIAELGFEAADRHLATTLEALRGCTCRDGCPSCVQSPKCGNGNAPLSKPGAIRLLEAILQ